VVRHPLYLGNFLMWLGVSLVPRCWWFTALTVLIFWLYYERIMFAEEGFLEECFGEDYRRWAAATPAFIPKFHTWVKPALPFSLRAAVAREYSGLFAVIAVFTLFQAMRGWFARGDPGAGPLDRGALRGRAGHLCVGAVSEKKYPGAAGRGQVGGR
jgi:hypothetical protein